MSGFKMELIDVEDRKNQQCFFCETKKSVKYIFTVNILGKGLSLVHCCNKCAASFMTDFMTEKESV